jgi:phosphatidylserine decarboxylase
MRIASQGFGYIAILLLAGLLVYFAPPVRWLAWVFVGLAAFVTFFFRDPRRSVPSDPSLLVSPGDGKVVQVGPAPSDPSRNQISIFLSIFDVHINRSPLDATVAAIRYTPGQFVAAYHDDAGSRNERNELELVDGEYRILVRQIAGVVARRIVCATKERDHLDRGERFGLIQFGSRMEIVLPQTTEILVKVGDRVRGGETPIGRRP